MEVARGSMNYLALSFFIVIARGFQINTVPQLNFSQYVGRWYQVYADRATDLTIERGCYCPTVHYELVDDDTFTLINACRRNAPNGSLIALSGTAHRPDPKVQGKLIVKLNETNSPKSYWVIQLGPATYNGNFYQYSVVTDAENVQLSVLARDVTGFMIDYDEKVLNRLHLQGFTKFLNEPILAYQGIDCKYT